jgi:lipopolysaccharide/colanic/teichoic acid biosynthesis glycosyltransferase
MIRIMARLTGLILLIACLPVLLVLALVVMVLQGRPVLFHQIRSGKGGKPFTMVKFRSMRDLRDADGVPLPDAERVTGVGTFLRRSRLDELPGLWNVITGDIAFIGPRPLLPETIAGLGERGVRRGQVAPGLTGWSQVNGNTLLTLDEKIDLDLWYIENRSLRTDCMVLLATVWVMLGGEKRSNTIPARPAESGTTQATD